jgi:hypothetical protein
VVLDQSYRGDLNTFNFAERTTLVNFEPGIYYKKDLVHEYRITLLSCDNSCPNEMKIYEDRIEVDDQVSVYASVCSASLEWPIQIVSFGKTEEESKDNCNSVLKSP